MLSFLSGHFLSYAIVGITLLGVAVGRLPGLKLDRAVIALVGATLVIALGCVTPARAFSFVDLNTIALLLGMMLVVEYQHACGLFDVLAARIMRSASSPPLLLAVTMGVTGALAALFMNDTVVLVFTPLVLRLAKRLERNPVPYLIGVGLAANVGSVAAITGNPQNMLVGSASALHFATFSSYLAPVAAVGLVVAWGCVRLVYREEFGRPFDAGLDAVEVRAPSAQEARAQRWGIAVAVALAVALLMGAPVTVASLVAGALLAVSAPGKPGRIVRKIDGPLLLFFAGLFVVTGTLIDTGAPARLFAELAPLMRDGPLGLGLVAAALSNVVSNVPAVMLMRPVIPTLAHPQTGWLTLAAASTLAGNLTLLGSVANLIVVELARRKQVEVSFVEFLKTGVPVTLLTLALALGWLTVVA